MLRSIRVPLLAGFVALMFAACGGGGGNDPDPDGGLPGDGGHIQFDAQKDGLQQDAQTDTGAGCSETCNPSGGAQIAGFCKCTSDCACGSGNVCANPAPSNTTIAASCWKSCTASTECATGTEECVGITQTLGACLTKGTISGTFTDVPSWLDSESPTQTFGSAAMTITVGTDINVTFGGGMASKVTFSDGSTAWETDLFPMAGTAPDLTKVLRIIIDEADYGVKTYDLSTSQTAYINYENWTISGSALTAESWQAMVLGGTFTMTAAGTGGGAAVTGSITNGEAYRFILELCGSHSKPCG